MNRNPEQEMARIIRTVMDNGRAATQEELAIEFDAEATEQGWTDEEIQVAVDSPWFPKF